MVAQVVPVELRSRRSAIWTITIRRRDRRLLHGLRDNVHRIHLLPWGGHGRRADHRYGRRHRGRGRRRPIRECRTGGRVDLVLLLHRHLALRRHPRLPGRDGRPVTLADGGHLSGGSVRVEGFYVACNGERVRRVGVNDGHVVGCRPIVHFGGPGRPSSDDEEPVGGPGDERDGEDDTNGDPGFGTSGKRFAIV